MSTIPPEAKQAMTAVVAAMGGDDYNYYSDFSTTVASSGRASIVATFRVVVPQVQRQKATAIRQHANKATEKPHIRKGIQLLFHPIFLV